MLIHCGGFSPLGAVNNKRPGGRLLSCCYFSYARMASFMNLPLLGCRLSFSMLSRSHRKFTIFCPRSPRATYALRTRSFSSIFFVIVHFIRLNLLRAVVRQSRPYLYTSAMSRDANALISWQWWWWSRHSSRVRLQMCA